jgi:ATP-binding cassette, subfamily F, member 3
VLNGFGGTLLLVSHDRYLIQSLATHVWIAADGAMDVVEGGWDEYVDQRAKAQEARGPAADPSATKADRAAQKQARRQRKDLEKLQARRDALETEIQGLEDQLAVLSDTISAAGEAQDMDRVHELGTEYRGLEKRLEGLWEGWEELAECIEAS